jgi:hypothetical protein
VDPHCQFVVPNSGIGDLVCVVLLKIDQPLLLCRLYSLHHRVYISLKNCQKSTRLKNMMNQEKKSHFTMHEYQIPLSITYAKGSN